MAESPDPITIEDNPADSDSLKGRDGAAIVQQRDNGDQSGSFASVGDRILHPPTICAPQPHAFYFGGYDNTTSKWDEYRSYINAERLDIGSPGLYNDNSSVVFHAGYGYGPQIPYGPYSPVTTPLPSANVDVQLYSPQQFPFSGPPYFQQVAQPSMPYITSLRSAPQSDFNRLAIIDQQADNLLIGPRPNHRPSVGSYRSSSFPGNPGTFGFHDMEQGFDGSLSGGVWSDWLKPSDRYRSFSPFSSGASPQPVGSFGSIGQNHGMASQQQRLVYGSSSYGKGYVQGSSLGRTTVSSLGSNSRAWLSLENSRQRGEGNVSLDCSGSLDLLGERNRGPRASKPKTQGTTDSSVDSKQNTSIVKIQESCNRPDFVTDYQVAKFFIIKSYSEDNVHKSIKYGVWASTANGNKKLDAAYREAKEKQDPCRVYLFFSVNASAQFCGVAEMIGPVDFDKSVDYWQQDKWNGQFPVKWHIIKDVPNSQFRHIVLEYNDNKPVTNSRDTQEVKLEQGIEMLKIFKKYENDLSMLDDFEFYEGRQKAFEERKARQKGNFMAICVTEESERMNVAAMPNEYMKQMSESFAQVLSLDEGVKGVAAKTEDIVVPSATSAQTS